MSGDRSGERSVVLLVEDEATIRQMEVEILRERGYRVHAVANAGEARRLAAGCERLDLVLVDVVLPDGDGTVLSDELRLRYPELKVIAMSGYADDVGDRVADAFIDKPFDIAELLATVRRVLGEG